MSEAQGEICTSGKHPETMMPILNLPGGGRGCMACTASRNISGGLNNNHIPYPTKEQFAALAMGETKETGKSISGRVLTAQADVAAPATNKNFISLAQSSNPADPFERCIEILKAVPAPRELKEYKKLMKLISTLEELKGSKE